MTTTWSRVECTDAKAHFVPDVLVDGTVDDLAERGMPLVCVYRDITKIYFERNGSNFMDAPDDVFVLDGLMIVVPSCDVGLIAHKLHDSIEREYRTTSGYQLFHKIHGRYACLVLSPLQRLDLMEQMETATALADEKYVLFLDAWAAEHGARHV